MRNKSVIIYLLLSSLLTTISLPSRAVSATIYDFNESGASAITWPGWTWSNDVTSYGNAGWTKNSGHSMNGDWYPRSFQKTDYGTKPQATIITTDRAPSTSSGGALKVSDTGTDKQACWWFVSGDNWGTLGYADANTNRWSQYIKFSGLNNSGLTTSDPANYNIEIGTYLCWPGGGLGGENCPKEANGQHYYHQLNVPSGTWLHVLLDKHPSHQRGVDSTPANDPAGSAYPYYKYFFGYYIDIPYAQSQATSWILDEVRVYQEPNAENDISICNMWIGYFPTTGKWQVGFDDLSFAAYNNSSVSKHEIRWSISPITNTNWSSAKTIVPEYNRYNTTNSFRRPNSWKRLNFTQFTLPTGTEALNNKIYFAIKDTSATVDGDSHNAPSANVKTIDYNLRPSISTAITAPNNLRVSMTN